jgi:hypothetical protein
MPSSTTAPTSSPASAARPSGSDAGERAGQPAAFGAARRVQHPGDQFHAQGVRGAFGRPLRRAGAEPEAEGERQVDHGEHDQPTGQRAGVPLGHPAVDDDADEHRNERLAGLVAGAEHGAERHAAALSGDGSPEHPPARRVDLSHHASGSPSV